MVIRHAKWYFNVSKWHPSRDEWLKLTSSIEDEELLRINKFVYKEDAKSSLIGRSMIRKFVSEATSQPSNSIALDRTQHGKPIFVGFLKPDYGDHQQTKFLDFNVSHSGDHCVLVGVWDDEPIDMTVGVDVTKIVSKQTKTELDRFLDLMSRREFTKEEWDLVENVEADRQKCINFTRLWCLKESFIKSIGLGLSFKLNRISFIPNEACKYDLKIDMLKDKIVSDTKVLLDGRLTSDWHFQETALDDQHLVAVGYNLKSGADIQLDQRTFQKLDISSLVNSLTPIQSPKERDWLKFCSNSSKDHVN